MRFGSILVAALPVVALANPSVTITSVTQNFPWNGKVNIAYTVSGAEGEGSWAVSFTGKTGEGESFSLRTFAETPSAVNGSHVAVWDSAADGAQFSGGQAFVASAKLGRSDVTYDGEYMVIDVSGGREATSYPVSFAEASSTAAFNTDEYKTGKIVLKKVKAGTFLMGSPEDEEGRNKSLYNYPTGGPETQHYVKFEKDFYFSVFPVTCCQFTNVVAYAVEPWSADTCKPVNKQSYTDLRVDGGFFDVVNKKVSFDGSLLTGFHLPTESQWEYVCRAGTTTPYYFGESGDDFATYCGKWGTYAKVVGTLPANPWGFYDMLGGNFMMCQDRQGEYPLGTQDNPAVDPVHGNDTGYAIRRGYISGTESGWQETYFYRSACRNSIAEGTRNTSTSFQLAMTRTDVDKYEAKAVAEGVVFNTDVTKEDIADATVLLSSDELIYDGTEKKPTMTVTFGATDLKENTDYAVSYSDPVNAGTCMLTLTGLGHYAGVKKLAYYISYPQVGAEVTAKASLDFRDGVLEARAPGTLFKVAHNNTVDWQRGGIASETVKARVAFAPLASEDATPDEADFVTAVETDREGSFKVGSSVSGLVMARLQVVDGDAVVSTLTRVLRISRSGILIIVR